MKNVIFALAFMLIGMSSFANTKEEKSVKLDKIIKKLKLNKDLNITITQISKNVFRCTATVEVVDEDGGLIRTVTVVDEEINTQEGCDQLADELADFIDSQENP